MQDFEIKNSMSKYYQFDEWEENHSGIDIFHFDSDEDIETVFYNLSKRSIKKQKRKDGLDKSFFLFIMSNIF